MKVHVQMRTYKERWFMVQYLIDLLNEHTGKKYEISDLRRIENGNRAAVYSVKDEYIIKTDNRDFDCEEKAISTLEGCSFLPEIVYVDIMTKTIFMEYLKGNFFSEYILKYKKLPGRFIEEYYDMKILMAERLCTDWDDKFIETCWYEDNTMKKVDYGQAECYTKQKNILDVYSKKVDELKQEKEGLLKKDIKLWNKLRQRLLYDGVSNNMIDSYIDSL